MPTKRSANTFARGARTGVLFTLVPMSVNTESNAKIESKDEMGKRGLPSPDRADAVMQTCRTSRQSQTFVDG